MVCTPGPGKTSFAGRSLEVSYEAQVRSMNSPKGAGRIPGQLSEDIGRLFFVPRILSDFNKLCIDSGDTLRISGGEITPDIRKKGEVGDIQRDLTATKGQLIQTSWQDGPRKQQEDTITLVIGALYALGFTVLIEWLRPLLLD